MNVVFRVDSSLSIGTGHIIRCLNIATKFKSVGAECFFVTKTHYGNIIDRIAEAQFAVKTIIANDKNDVYIEDELKWLGGSQENDAKIFCNLISDDDIDPDMIIVDHYSLDNIWERNVKSKFPTCKLVVIDDLCNRMHYCDFIVDQTFGREPQEYRIFNSNDAKLLIGPEYALLHTDFRKLRQESCIRKSGKKKSKKLLLTMGGVDRSNVTGKIISFLNNFKCDFIDEIDVVIGPRYPFENELQKQILDSKYTIRIHQNISNMPELMMDADIAVGALGGTTWERCVMGLPAVNISIANNQKTIAEKMSAAGMIVIDEKSLHSQLLLASLLNLNENYDVQKQLTNTICDGHGLTRVIQKLVSIPARDGVNVELTPATESDTEFVYKLQCMDETRRYARNPRVPSWDEHKAWMKNKLKDKTSFFYIINHESKCGVLRLDAIQDKKFCYEISIFLSNICFGKGIASAAIKRAIFLHKSKNIIATVHPDNIASNNLFNSIGFTKISKNQFAYKVM